jgi:putative SOS response-associated peptidase YedK
MLTTEPNAEVRGVGHHRMPVLLTSKEQYDRWLDPEISERGPLEELLRPVEDGTLACYVAEPRPAGGSGGAKPSA